MFVRAYRIQTDSSRDKSPVRKIGLQNPFHLRSCLDKEARALNDSIKRRPLMLDVNEIRNGMQAIKQFATFKANEEQ